MAVNVFSVSVAQVVWTGGDKSTSLWCAYSGAFLGTIDRGKELGLPESSSFSRESQPRSLADEWRAKIDTNKASTTHPLLSSVRKHHKQSATQCNYKRQCLLKTGRTCPETWQNRRLVIACMQQQLINRQVKDNGSPFCIDTKVYSTRPRAPQPSEESLYTMLWCMTGHASCSQNMHMFPLQTEILWDTGNRAGQQWEVSRQASRGRAAAEKGGAGGLGGLQ